MLLLNHHYFDLKKRTNFMFDNEKIETNPENPSIPKYNNIVYGDVVSGYNNKDSIGITGDQ